MPGYDADHTTDEAADMAVSEMCKVVGDIAASAGLAIGLDMHSLVVVD